jgi:hypothetical protein
MKLEKVTKDKDFNDKVYLLTLDEEFRLKYMPESWITSGKLILSPKAEEELLALIGKCISSWENK